MLFSENTKQDLPAKLSEDWQVFIIDHFAFSAQRINIDITFETWKEDWKRATRFYERLMIDKIISHHTVIPIGCGKSEIIEAGKEETPPLGASCLTPPIPACSLSEWPKRCFISTELNKTDEEFLGDILFELNSINDSVYNACQKYWNDVMSAHDMGRKMINNIPTCKLLLITSSSNPIQEAKKISKLPLRERTAWFLAIVNYYFTKTKLLNAISFESMSEIPILKAMTTSARRKDITNGLNEILGNHYFLKISSNEKICRSLGMLSARDCAAAACIIIKDNPCFPSMGLQSANLLTVGNRPYLHLTSDDKQLIFGVDKPRAKSRKISIFNEKSAKIFKQLVEATKKGREKIKNSSNSSAYRYLFITVTRYGSMSPGNIDKIITGNIGQNLYDTIKHDLTNINLNKETFTLSSIRVTQGIIEFLNTGSINAVAKLLGNTAQTVLSSYIPNWLIARHAIKGLRVFQQKIVIVSSANKPWLLEISDFESEKDLLKFIAKMLTEATGQDAMAADMHRKLSGSVPHSEIMFTPLIERNLRIDLCPESLGNLYAYAEYSKKNLDNDQLNLTDEETGLTPQAFIYLADLISDAAENKYSSEVESAIQSSLKGKSFLEFTLTHKKALRIAEHRSSNIKVSQIFSR
ncbi:hypothetical protein [Pseudomonas sp. BE134]|uniref:hypothetical protein n=1 Tax=Pseudomonas sp. BE134 TaxID=2817843 RepID=UPI002865D742|nr:hypothetical protein [Pseudomonas sp. BE134]MDR6929544.1 hypothetical protein [Pseudomonas sp. BE134]